MENDGIRFAMIGLLALSTTVVCLFAISHFSDCHAVSVNQTYRVHNLNTGLNYELIQNAINDTHTLDGHTLKVDAGIYFEHLIVTKSLSIVGYDRVSTILNGNGTTGTVVLVTAEGVTIEGFTVKNGSTGMLLYRSNNSTIRKNRITQTNDAILVRYSNSCRIAENIVENNHERGILVSDSRYFNVSDNIVFGTEAGYGINANFSMSGLIARNSAYANYFDGIGLGYSSFCEIVANNVTDNVFYGIWLQDSSDNHIYHNNLFNNYRDAVATAGFNFWDDSYPSGGNYWGNYTGTDPDHDGIGNTPYEIGAGNYDLYPLMAPFIIPEFPSVLPVLLILPTGLFLAVAYRKGRRRVIG